MKHDRQPSITTGPGCVLRPWDLQDVAELVRSQRDPLIRRYATRLIDDQDQALDAIQGWTRRWADGRGAAWALRSDTPGRDLLGGVGYAIRDEHIGTGSTGVVGYWLLPHARGRGLASAALRRSCVVAFQQLGWFRIELSHATENERSCAVARRAGFAPEGVLRSAMVYAEDGRRSDEHLHARLRTDPVPGV